MLDITKKFIFIHIPKTGGTSITKFLYPNFSDERLRTYSKKHFYISDYIKEGVVNLDEFFKFAFVRNPYERALSHYFYLAVDRLEPRYKITYSSFYDFARKIDIKCRYSQPQADCLLDEKGKLCVDFVGKFENLQEDFNFICDKISAPRQKLPHINKTNHKHYSQYCDDRTLELIQKMYAKDFEYFDYEY